MEPSVAIETLRNFMYNFHSQCVYNGGGMKNNKAGSLLASQEIIRLAVLCTKEIFYAKLLY